MQVNLEIEPRNLDALSREYRKDANGILDQATVRSVAESGSAGESPDSGAARVYGNDILDHAVLATSSDEISPHLDGSERVQQLHALRTRNPNSQMLPERIQSVDPVRPPVTGQGEQRFTFQHDDFKGPGELLETAAEITLESASPGAVPFHLADRDHAATMRPDDLRGNLHPTVDRIVGEIDGRIRFGKQEAILQLDPPELGKLRIDLHMAGDKLTARILTETHQSRTLIEMHLGELRQALGENRVELLDVRVDSFSWTGPRGESQQGTYRESNDRRDLMHAFDSVGPDTRNETHPVRQAVALYRPGRVSMWA